MANNRYAKIARETLHVANTGSYMANCDAVDISADILYTNNNTAFISQQDADMLETAFEPNGAPPFIELHDETTLAAILRLADKDCKLGVLNFASAKNPGGGFLNGAMAQEESLAAASALYLSQKQCPQYYSSNRTFKSFMYTDCAIWSPDVVFFRNDNADFISAPVKAHVLTIPAVNLGQVITKNEDVANAKSLMKRRMKIALAVFADKSCSTIILGAFGCGVFRNNPAEVAVWWDELLQEYGGHFYRVVFSIFDRSRKRSTLEAFAKSLRAVVDNNGT